MKIETDHKRLFVLIFLVMAVCIVAALTVLAFFSDVYAKSDNTIWIPISHRQPVIEMSQPEGSYSFEYLGLHVKSYNCTFVYVKSIPYYWQYHNECVNGEANVVMSLGDYELINPVIVIDGVEHTLFGVWTTGVEDE